MSRTDVLVDADWVAAHHRLLPGVGRAVRPAPVRLNPPPTGGAGRRDPGPAHRPPGQACLGPGGEQPLNRGPASRPGT